ncbi:MAG: PqqD family protein [Longimicrobiaceae bacterium]
MTPEQRREQLLTSEVGGERVVYDLERDRAHRLNPTTSRVWSLCDGRRTVEEIAAQLGPALDPRAGEHVVWLALEQLDRAGLLREPLDRSREERRLTRREVLALGVAGVAAFLLPGCDSIVVPAPHARLDQALAAADSLPGPPPPESPPPPGPPPPPSPPPPPPGPPPPGPPPPPPPPPPSRCEPVLELKEEGIRKVGERTETQTVERHPHRFTRVLAVERDFRPNYLMGSPKCKGKCGPGKDGKCREALTFRWRITAQDPAGIATITAGANAEEVTVRFTGNGTITLELTVTLQCMCGNRAEGPPVTKTDSIKSNVNVFA